jgi:hypothetical protein
MMPSFRPRYWDVLGIGHLVEVRRALRGLAFGLALAVRPAGLAEAPALKGGCP